MKGLTRENFSTFVVLVASLGVGVILGGRSDGEAGRLEELSGDRQTRLTALSTSGDLFASAVVAEAAELKGYDSEMDTLLRTMPLGEFPAMAEMLVGRYRAGNPAEFPAYGISKMLTVWAERDPAAALAWYEDSFPAELGGHVRDGLFLGWGRSDPEAALAYIETEVGASAWADDFEVQVFDGMSVVRPDLALALLEDFPGKGEKKLGFALGRYHPERCVEFLQKIPEGTKSRKAIVESMLLGITDSATLSAVLEVLPDSEKGGYGVIEARKMALEREVSQLSGQEFLDRYRRAGGDGESDQHGLLLAMAETRPQKLVSLLREMEGEIPSSFVRAVGNQLRDGFQGEEFNRAMLKGLLSIDGVALADVEDVMKGFGRGSVRGHGVMDLVADLEGEVKMHATVGMLEGVASRSIDRAVESFDKVEDAATRERAAEVIARRWALADPKLAVEWAVGESERAIRAAVSTWAENDPAASSEWVAAIPEGGRGRDSSVAGLVKGLEQSELVGEALAWFEEINDPEIRESLRMELRGGVTEAEFDLEIAEELDAGEAITPELEAQYRQLYFGK